jgi:hypothetical protein
MYSASDASSSTGLLHLLVALAMHINVLPRSLVNEGQFIGSRSDDFAIFGMEPLAEMCALATHDIENRV